MVDSVIQSLQTKFALKDLGKLHYFLGVEASWSTDGLFLSQNKYIRDLLVKAKMDAAKSISTPACPKVTFTSSSEDFIDLTLYQSVVGIF